MSRREHWKWCSMTPSSRSGATRGRPPPRKDDRGYRRLYEDCVLRANEGCDLDFLRGRSAVVSDAVTYL
jgi:hypothetical protein